MVFSSSIFMFFFLPFVLFVYFILMKKRRTRNMFLMVMSLLFYAWGEPWFVFVMLASIAVNWLAGLGIDKYRSDPARKKRVLVLALVFNVGLLGVFKYLMFVMENVNWVFGLHLPIPRIVLPIGISFFTFQAISYIVDVYRDQAQVQKSFWNVCLYIAFFPQLIAGPIVRYQTVAEEIETREENVEDFTDGCRRFLVGLNKKVLLANNLALIVDDAFAMPASELSTVSAWLAAIAYVLQTYYDFSGYSDMAIGLGKMFGFHFLENFNFPMLSKSVTGFWRRWHISLGSWFRDYLFFPLGGSRVKSVVRLLFNMFVVWSLTGLWHGAQWTFFCWGVVFFVFLIIERFTGLKNYMEKHWLGHVYTMLVLTTNSIIIRATDMGNAWQMVKSLYGGAGGGWFNANASMYLREYGWYILIGCVVSVPIGMYLQKALKIPDRIMETLRFVFLFAGFVLSLSSVIMGGYNPFIYFNF